MWFLYVRTPKILVLWHFFNFPDPMKCCTMFLMIMNNSGAQDKVQLSTFWGCKRSEELLTESIKGCILLSTLFFPPSSADLLYPQSNPHMSLGLIFVFCFCLGWWRSALEQEWPIRKEKKIYTYTYSYTCSVYSVKTHSRVNTNEVKAWDMIIFAW